MFVLLEHDTTQAVAVPPAERGVHWDLLIEVPTCERLPTWRLSRNPLETSADIPAQRIGDHRRQYLEFEGDVSGGRGRVRRTARGSAELAHFDDDRVVVVLESNSLRGRFEIVRKSPECAVFRRMLT